MKRQTVSCFAIALLLLFTLPAFPAAADSQFCDTQGEVEFIAGYGPVAPLDPDFPESALEDRNGVEITSDSDSLSLNVVPILTFAGENGQAFPAQTVGEGVFPLYSPIRPYVQVSDLRGTGSGWKLSVNADPFLLDGSPALAGAKIRLLGGTARSSNSALAPPAINSAVIVECAGSETAAPVTIADTLGDSNSMGAWVIRWYPLDSRGQFTASEPVHMAGIDLLVPSGTLMLPGNYSTTLYWTLSDVA